MSRAAPAGAWSRDRRSPGRSIALHLTLIAASIVSVFPVARLVLTSLKPRQVIETASVAPIEQPTLANYTQVLGETGFLTWAANSLIVRSVRPFLA